MRLKTVCMKYEVEKCWKRLGVFLGIISCKQHFIIDVEVLTVSTYLA